MYYSDKETGRLLKQLESNIKREYNRAYREMVETWENYINGYDEQLEGKKVHHKSLKERYDEEYQAFLEGKYTEDQFKAWYKTQVERGEGYKKMADSLASRLVQADEMASAFINDTTPNIYSLNHNYEAYLIDMVQQVDFHLIDSQTVKQLMLDTNFTDFKVTRINPLRDYEWNSKQIKSALTAGILQGKSIEKIADSYMQVMKRDRSSAIRNARTSVTSAQNAGRLKSYEEAQKQGIYVQKQWRASLDGRTRDTHAELDGETRDPKEAFSNGLQQPADPSGAPAEVYNCRCTLRAFFPEYNNIATKRAYKNEDGYREYEDDGTPKTLNNVTYTGKGKTMSYKDWLNGKLTNSAKIDLLFDYEGTPLNEKNPFFKKEEVIEIMGTTEVGRHALSYIEDNLVKVDLNCDPQDHDDRGESYPNSDIITIFTTNCKNSANIIAQTVIHETIHLEHNIGGCRHAECICYAYEKMHKENRTYLTKDEWNMIKLLVKDNYDDQNWEKGGYGDFTKFNFIK